MKQMAHIADGKVVNVSLWDGVSEWHPDEQVIEIPQDQVVGIGWDYVNNSFVDNRPVEVFVMPTQGAA